MRESSRFFSRLISLISSLYSSSIFSRSRPVSRASRISRMASACRSDSLNFAIRPWRAVSVSLDFLMSAMTASMFFKAIFRPSRMWARSSACFSSNWVRA